MIVTALAFLLSTLLFLLPPQLSRVDLLKQADELQTALDAKDWKRAAELSSSLKSAIEAVRNASIRSTTTGITDSILAWLPADTETVIVAQQPMQISKVVGTKEFDGLAAAQGTYVQGLLRVAEGGSLMPGLLGQTIRLAVVGARRFAARPTAAGRVPIGMINYQGCAAYSFAAALPQSLLARSFDEQVMGHPVWISKGAQNEGEKVDIYTVLLKPEFLLVCNDRSFMSEMVARSVTTGGARALSETLREWNLVDRTAPLWAVRHKQGSRSNTVTPLPLENAVLAATGITIEIGASGSIKSRMLTASDPWRELTVLPDAPAGATSREVSKGMWELSCDGSLAAVFLVMATLGFEVIL